MPPGTSLTVLPTINFQPAGSKEASKNVQLHGNNKKPHKQTHALPTRGVYITSWSRRSWPEALS